MLADHLIFIGFMGAGKTSVAQRVARFAKLNCIDMDTYLEREAGMSVARIFELEGEAGFRQREWEFLRGMLIRDRCVLACGGGVVVREDSRELLKQLGTVVYLMVDVAEALARISEPASRPLLVGETPPAELLAARLSLYEDLADVTIDTNGRTVAQVVSEVQQRLREMDKL